MCVYVHQSAVMSYFEKTADIHYDDLEVMTVIFHKQTIAQGYIINIKLNS